MCDSLLLYFPACFEDVDVGVCGFVCECKHSPPFPKRVSLETPSTRVPTTSSRLVLAPIVVSTTSSPNACCPYTRTYIHTAHTHTHTHTHTFHIHICTHVHTCMHTYVQACTCACMTHSTMCMHSCARKVWLLAVALIHALKKQVSLK